MGFEGSGLGGAPGFTADAWVSEAGLDGYADLGAVDEVAVFRIGVCGGTSSLVTGAALVAAVLGRGFVGAECLAALAAGDLWLALVEDALVAVLEV